ncbi:MAG: D-alanine--D-alanine ligase [Deltaproteobacteria bacterium]|nr:D-alanine--D-alanine ligase [Deltaproteobacteria bacterium]
MEKLRVGIIMGGLSSEKEVSLNSGRNVYDNMDKDRYEPIPLFMDERGRFWILPWQLVSQNTTVDIVENLEKKARHIPYDDLSREIDFAFIALHGKYGDDGCIQGLLELLRIPYTGSGVLASALGMDKHMQQQILSAAGVATPRSVLIVEEEWRKDSAAAAKGLIKNFGIPLVTKPSREGSSIGVTIVRDSSMLEEAVESALVWDRSVLAEEFLEGTEFSCIVLEEDGLPRVLGVTEIHPQSAFYTYDDKYMPGRCSKFTPPKTIPPAVVERIRREVLKAYSALGFRSYGRIDGFVLNDGRVLVTDPNSSSGMAPSSFFFEQAAEAEMLPSMIISELIEISRTIHGRKKGPL